MSLEKNMGGGVAARRTPRGNHTCVAHSAGSADLVAVRIFAHSLILFLWGRVGGATRVE